MKTLFFFLAALTAATTVCAQFTISDSLRGGYGKGRDWWDLKHYELSVDFDAETKTLRGSNKMTFDIVQSKLGRNNLNPEIQIDLQDPMIIDSIRLHNAGPYSLQTGSQGKRIGNAYLFEVPPGWLQKYPTAEITVWYHGKPKEAVNPPWDGGVIWKKDPNGNPWITVACQGLGASVWFPCKDSQIDEPDNGAVMHYTCDSKLVCVSNGRFVVRKDLPHGRSTYTWEVTNPINNYCMIPYIGDYVNMHEHYQGEKGMLELDYWVIRGNEEKAAQQFKDAPRTIEAFEYWFGPYPFYEDGYKLVEAPHLGMEHQSAVAYGNGYRNGYLGKDLSGTGGGLLWDFIIVHESGHEWFGNNITSKDIADMWIHESFTNYSETLFMDYWFGSEKANAYCIGLRRSIFNDRPIIGPYGVNTEGSGDMYYKGANMLHTIRQLVHNDTTFRMMLREMNAKFYHRTVTTQEIEQFMSDYLKLDLASVFDQYLRSKYPPTLETKYGKKKMRYRWINTVEGFDMPVLLDNYGWIEPSSKWKKVRIRQGHPVPLLNRNFYVKERREGLRES
jgi:aminopeptidase N